MAHRRNKLRSLIQTANCVRVSADFSLYSRPKPASSSSASDLSLHRKRHQGYVETVLYPREVRCRTATQQALHYFD